MNSSLLVITPPLLVIACVLATRRMILSFMIGILLAALIATGANLQQSINLIIQRFLESAGISQLTSWQGLVNNWNLSIFIFLCSLGALITILQSTGAATAFGTFVKKFVHTRKSAEVASLILSPFFFIDDYFSALTVGSIMRPIAAIHGLSPVKLAFLVTAMASPITILAPISSWVGEIILQLKQAGIATDQTNAIVAADPFYVFIYTIPCIFYAILLIFSTWYIVLRGISFGPMALAEQKKPVKQEIFAKTNSTLKDFLAPLITLISSIFIMLLVTGDYSLFGGANDVINALKNGVVHQALLVGGLVTLISSSLYFLLKKQLTSHALFKNLYDGAWLMLPSIFMLIHAWTLGSILKQDLHTGDYIAHLFGLVVTVPAFPALCFIIAALISALIGSAWATIGLMFPIIIPMLQALLTLPTATTLSAAPLLLPIIGASLSGCVMGTHLSFIADNPIMSAASTGAHHLEHIKTMAWYVIPVGIATTIAYLVVGYYFALHGLHVSVALAIISGLIASISLLEFGQFFFGKKKS